MKTNPILAETWQVKDELARETGHDIHRLFALLRDEARRHPQAGAIHDAAELRRLAVQIGPVRYAQHICSSARVRETPRRKRK